MQGERQRERQPPRQKKAEKEAARAVMPGNVITVVPRRLSSGTVKQLLHSTCHSGPPL